MPYHDTYQDRVADATDQGAARMEKTMRPMRGLLALTVVALAALAADTETAVVEIVANGQAEINWTTGVITASGLGPVPRSGRKNFAIQRRVAQLDAYRQLAEAVRGVHVTSETTVEMYELVSDSIRTDLDTFLKGQQVISEGWMEDKETYRMTLAAPLLPSDGSPSVVTVVLPELKPEGSPDRELADPEVVIEKCREKNETLPPDKRVTLPPKDIKPVDLPVEQPASPPDFPKEQKGPFTGLVIDCRGFQIQRAMSPKVMTADEDEVWGTVSVSPEFVLNTGIVGYLPSLEMALGGKVSRAGDHPLVVRCIGRQGSFRANAIVSDDDAARIKAEDERTKFLSQFRVVFVIDPK